jgi:hypothetical protein
MQKLLNTYLAKPTLGNARKIKDYNRKHPFASCVMTEADIQIIRAAIQHAENTSTQHS